MLFDVEYRGEVQPTEVDLVLAKQFLLSVHASATDLARRVTMRDGVGAVLAKGTDFLLYTIADRIVDGYFPMMDKLADEIDDLQDQVVESPNEWTLQKVFTMKKELLAIRRATSPAREVLNQLTNRELTVIAPEHLVYFRDVYDHLIRVTDELDNYRDLVAGTLDIYLSTVNNNLSRIMKRLTGVTVILAGIGAVAGIFGMSEAGSLIGKGEPSGFWLLTGVIVMLGVIAAVIPPDRLDLSREARSRLTAGAALGAGRAGAASGGRRRGVGWGGAQRRGDDLEHGRRPLRTLGRLVPERLGRARERVGEAVRLGHVAADLGDVVGQPHVVARVDLDEHVQHALAVVLLRLIEERQEHPLAGVAVEVERARESGLDEARRLGVHRDVAEDLVRGALDDRQVDLQGRDDDPCCEAVGGDQPS